MVYRCIWFTRTRNARPLLAVCTRITVGATTGRPQQIKPYRSFSILHSDSLRAAYGGCSLDAHCGGGVRPYGSAGADEFTNGVPRSYPRAPSLAALPQFTLSRPAEAFALSLCAAAWYNQHRLERRCSWRSKPWQDNRSNSGSTAKTVVSVSYTHLRAHET